MLLGKTTLELMLGVKLSDHSTFVINISLIMFSFMILLLVWFVLLCGELGM